MAHLRGHVARSGSGKAAGYAHAAAAGTVVARLFAGTAETQQVGVRAVLVGGGAQAVECQQRQLQTGRSGVDDVLLLHGWLLR
ncbi:hypothetical protein STPYR_12761 [uncultured Stenotrophomonas sp.]|uniref:Uncharacterized protein n=1 Tax=uncultured Stenotrophomonas sp. TaxID=165438 RepID=A0A1Y5Q678_9GAMM|nr:hypothetical protein STPYR_12761 [uncultured Stenotrophomonas sp.]